MSDDATFWKHVIPGARVILWVDKGKALAPATVVRLNKTTVTVRLTNGEVWRVPRPAIADLAAGERDRQHQH